MRTLVMPSPPDPANPLLKSDSAYKAAMYKWACDFKAKLESSMRLNDAPINQAFVVGSFTTNTMVTGTTTGTDLANFMSSLVKAMMAKGFVKPT